MRDFKYYIIGASILLFVYVAFLYNEPKPINWRPTLSQSDKIPFGTYIFYNRLSDVFPKAEVINTNQSIYSRFKQGLKPGNYIIVAKSVNLSVADYREMLKYIKAGNNVFITALDWRGSLPKELDLDTYKEMDADSNALNFTNPSLKERQDYEFDKEISTQYFSEFDTLKATLLGKNSAGRATFLSFQFGKGRLFVCANPQVFSNYSLLTLPGQDYAEKAISYLPAAKTIYWDQFQNHDIGEDSSPLRVFFKNPALQWAYYLSLFCLTIFVLFEVKRRQRVIPVIEPLKNSTLDFVNVVGKVYYEKRDNANIAYKKILYLLSYLREHYHLKTNTLDAEFIDTVSQKTGVSHLLISELVEHIKYLDKQQKVTDNELIILNQLIEKFYSQA